MLKSLDIRDMLIIDRLDLEFQPGLNVLTGETGAGKSILLDALGFVLGWRGRAELVREGADHGEVIAVFELQSDHPILAQLSELGLPAESELILRRINRADGRKTAWVNDRRVSGEILRGLSTHLVELHGQHDDRGLLNPRGHRQLLDEFAGLGQALSDLRGIWRQLGAAQSALAEAETRFETARGEEEFLRHAVEELQDFAAEAGEDDALDAQRRMMQNAQRVREDIAKAAQALGPDGAEGSAADALRWLEGIDPPVAEMLSQSVDALTSAINDMARAQQGVDQCLDDLNYNAHDLEQVEERLFALRALARKHGVGPDDLPGLAERLASQLSVIDNADGELAELQAQVAKARLKFENLSQDISERRKQAAKQLDRAMMTELAPLKMERAVFATEFATADPGPDGVDAVAFTVATNPGAPSGPLNRIASGGELSRFLLALKVCLSSGADGMTMIFDEIDRGVGGATADAVGRRLKSLAEGAQVLVVTHSPQVAARGAHHWQVSKNVRAGRTLSTVTPLDEVKRIDELARMLSGDKVTDAARAAAGELLRG